MPDLDGTVALVTGANTGIGKATAAALAAQGATVVLACRSEAKATPVVDELVRSTDNGSVELLTLDLADLASVRRAAGVFLERDRPLHLLVNNAGVCGQRGLTTDGFEVTFGVNHLGHFLLTTLVLPRLIDSAPARIINVASGSHNGPKGINWKALRRPAGSVLGLREYGVSKLCNVLFTLELADRLDPAAVSAFSGNPGPVATDLFRHSPRVVYEVFRRLWHPRAPAEGAAPILYAATHIGLEASSGAYLDPDCQPRPPSAVATAALRRELWDRSEAWIATSR